MVRMGRGPHSSHIDRGEGSVPGYYPAAAAAAMVSYTSPPQPRFIYQTSPTLISASPIAAATASPQFYTTTPTAAYFDTASPKRAREEQQLNMPTTMLVEVPTGHPRTSIAVKTPKNSVQVMQ